MSKIVLINCDAAPDRTNYTEKYLSIIAAGLPEGTGSFRLSDGMDTILKEMAVADKILFAMPLQLETLPTGAVRLLKATKTLSAKVYGLFSTDLLEFGHSDNAESQLKLFCERVGAPYGCAMKIGGGHQLYDTYYRVYLKSKLRKFTKKMLSDSDENVGVQMPMGKQSYVLGSDRFIRKKCRLHGLKLTDL